MLLFWGHWLFYFFCSCVPSSFRVFLEIHIVVLLLFGNSNLLSRFHFCLLLKSFDRRRNFSCTFWLRNNWLVLTIIWILPLFKTSSAISLTMEFNTIVWTIKTRSNLLHSFLRDLQEKWSKSCGEVELFQDISLLTLDSILKCAFSYKSNCQIEKYLVLPMCSS